MKTKMIAASCLMCLALNMTAQQAETFLGSVVADEGAWCWFADPRAIHYKSADGAIDAAYIGYIDVHGAIKASQVDFKASANKVFCRSKHCHRPMLFRQ